MIKWIGQDDNQSTSKTYLEFVAANKNIEIASGGNFVIQSNEGGAIVPADQELEHLNRGVLDVAHNGPILWVANFPDSPMFSTIIGGPTAAEYYFWYMYGDGLKLLNEMLDSKGYNAMAIAASAQEPEVFLYTGFEMKGPEDLKGKTMRLLGDEATIFGALGVAAVATPSPELYEAMQRGVIDGFQHSSLAADWAMGFAEVVKYAYVSPVRQPTDVYIYVVQKDKWNALPDAYKKMASEIWWAAGIRTYAEWTFKNTESTQDWVNAGVKVEPCPKSVEDAVKDSAAKYFADKVAKDPFFAKVYASLMAWRDAYDKTYPRL